MAEGAGVDQESPSKRRWIVIVAGALMGACLVCCAVAAGIQIAQVTLSAPMGGSLCIGATTTPRFQIGVTWYSWIMSSLPPLMGSPLAVCLNVNAPVVPVSHAAFLFPP